MRHFGPYGKLDNCIRSGDGAAKWVQFLKEDPPALVEEVERQMGNPCH